MLEELPREATSRPALTKAEAEAVEQQLQRAFSPELVNELRAKTGYNPRQRVGTALRLMLTVVEGFLLGQTLSFESLRALFVRRFGFMRPCPFQQRFKQAQAAEFFRAAVEHLVESVVAAAGLKLSGPLACFEDVRVYDGTGQRVPPRGRKQLPACTKGKAGTKWVMGYSIKTGLLEQGLGEAETASETPLWHRLVPSLQRGVLYLLDLGFFERAVFASAQPAGAHVLMRLKSNAKVKIVGHQHKHGLTPLPGWSIGYFLSIVSKRRGTTFDLDVLWGKGKHALSLRLVGYCHKSSDVRWYLTTVPRELLTPEQVIQSYRLRWLVELLFRELKQAANLGRSFTADVHAIRALAYGAMLAHVLVRAIRIQATLEHQIPLEQLRPLASLNVVRAHARDIADALASACTKTWNDALRSTAVTLLCVARELKPSRSRPRIARELGAFNA